MASVETAASAAASTSEAASASEAATLQDGIYLQPGPLPKELRLAVLDFAPGTGTVAAGAAVGAIYALLGELREGVVRELAATRPDEPDVEIDPGTFDFLLGYGASFFDPERGLTAAARPDLLTPLAHPRGPFASLRWAPGVPARSGEGDLCLQLTGRDSHAVGRALVEIWKLIADERLPLTIRESFDGFARDDGRSWIGFHDGVSNIRPSQRLAAVRCTGDPDWNRGGTYLAFLRCAVDLPAWRELTREEQEVLVGRDKLSGCALERVDTVDGRLVPRPFAGCPATATATPEELDVFRDPPETGDPILESSHIHRSNQNRSEPTTAAGHRIFRQGYEYLEPMTATAPGLGLNFVSFQSSLEHVRQILGLSSWLGGVNFGGRTPGSGAAGPEPIEIVDLRAGGFFVVPPRARPFPGAELFGTFDTSPRHA